MKLRLSPEPRAVPQAPVPWHRHCDETGEIPGGKHAEKTFGLKFKAQLQFHKPRFFPPSPIPCLFLLCLFGFSRRVGGRPAGRVTTTAKATRGDRANTSTRDHGWNPAKAMEKQKGKA